MPKLDREPVVDFGFKLRKIRINFGYTLGYIADHIGKSTTYVTHVERGERGAPEPKTLRKWLEALHMEDKFDEYNEQARLNRTNISVRMKTGHAANPHIARLIDAYQSGTLNEHDIDLLSLIARHESPYVKGSN